MNTLEKEFSLLDYNSENRPRGTYWERLAQAESKLMQEYLFNKEHRVEQTAFKEDSLAKLKKRAATNRMSFFR